MKMNREELTARVIIVACIVVFYALIWLTA